MHDNNLEITRLFLRANVSPNSRCKGGQTLLHIAAENGHTEMASLLLLHHIRPRVADDHGMLPLHLAAKHGHRDMIQLLLDPEVDPTQNPDRQSPDGYTPLHLAAYNGHGLVVKLLLSFDADPNLPGVAEWTPLHYAVAGESLVAVRVLLEHKDTHPNVANLMGETPLMLAERLESSAAIIKRLRSAVEKHAERAAK